MPGLPSLAPWLLYRQLLPLVKRACELFDPQVLDAQFGFPDGPAVAFLARKLGLPYTITLRGSEVLHATYGLRQTQLQNAFHGAAAIVAVSERLRSFAVSLGAPEHRTRTIPNGIDETVFYPQARSDCRREWKVTASDKLIVAAGNLIRLKGFDRLIRSVRTLTTNGVPVRLVLAGKGGVEAGFENELRSLPQVLGIADRVTFCGPLQQTALARLMCAADVFVLSSDREGWPNVVHEAMACGTPIVATDVGAVPEMLGDSDFGLIVPPRDQVALVQAIGVALQKQWDHGAISAWASKRGWRNAAAELCTTWTSVASQRLNPLEPIAAA